ncbi:glutamate--tRNA ligase [Azotosporobacter soli]|uniref:glutamate--tRNA ligase n=1 Tax=Azotosporobacter soli TaxID=3055040 RepID=UPI0031FE519C
MTQQMMRVRFAPSPTGPFHIGGARSALFNWLLARKAGGAFVLRVEDTDLDRSTKESEENIKEALRWLGLTWDEGPDAGGDYGPYHQTQRLDTYQQFTDRLLAEGKAYRCYCSEEKLESERQAELAKGLTPRYGGHCRDLSDAERQQFEAEGRAAVIRLRVPENKDVVIHDLVRGNVTFESNGIGDFVIVKSDGMPVYNYAVVIDDHMMKISHVIRAEEHLSNTPRQVVIYEALGLPVPEFGHISLILGKDRSKMSKRHGATSVEQYRTLGYLPEAIVNFLALLGWSPEGEQELFTLDELVQAFSMERVAKNPAVFDVDKLNWINAQYLKKADPALIARLALPHLQEAGFVGAAPTQAELDWLARVAAALQNHISYAAQMVEQADVFFGDTAEFENDEAKAILKDTEVAEPVRVFMQRLAAADVVDMAAVKTILKGITKELKLPGKKVFMPVRVAITGKMHGPELFDIIPLLGKERTLARMNSILAKLA